MDDVRLYEPRAALLDLKSPTGDGLGYYRAIASDAAPRLIPAGAVVLELGAGQADPVRAVFQESGFSSLTTKRDYGGIERVLVARR
jgi:release factor glutamine methyltransferase